MSSFNDKHYGQIVSGSLAASCFVAFTQIVSRGGEIPASLHAAILCFAIAVPVLVVVAVARIEQIEKVVAKERYKNMLIFFWLFPVVGIGCMFASYGGQALAAYLVGIVIATWLISKFSEEQSTQTDHEK